MARQKRGEMAKKCGVNIATLRYYEQRKLITPPSRSDHGYRFYSESDVVRVKFIKNAQKLGFSLGEIAELLKLRVRPGSTCSPVFQKAKNKLEEVERKIKGLNSIKKVLKKLMGQCDRNAPSTECPILESFESNGNKNE